MDQPRAGDKAPQAGTQDDAALAARRRMLKQSLGVAAPVALTLASTPVSAGTCVSASAFASIAAFASRTNRAVSPCMGLSPSGWRNLSADGWPVSKDTTFLSIFSKASGAHITPITTLDEVLSQPASMEAHITAVWLSAETQRLTAPFNTGQDVLLIWLNIMGNVGFYYHPVGAPPPKMTHEGTLDWLARTWS